MNGILRTTGHLFREARRRKVFRTAALYIVGAWLALQVANTLFPGFGIPDIAIRALFWTAVLGFPVALVFGWLFEIGSWGIRRTTPADADELAAPQPLARRDYLILAAFVAIAGAPGAYGLHALAWAYRHTGQEARATQLLESAARQCEELRSAGRLQDSLVIHRCAETELLRGKRERALAGLEEAVAAGWRDYYMRLADPYWTAVQDDPRFRRLMYQVRADIARQRAVVERDRPVEKVIARLDTAAAERDAPTGSAPASASSPR